MGLFDADDVTVDDNGVVTFEGTGTATLGDDNSPFGAGHSAVLVRRPLLSTPTAGRCGLWDERLPVMRAPVVVVSVVLAASSAGCSSDEDAFTLPEAEAERYPTAYLSRVEPAPEGDDLAEGGGEFVVIEQNADIRVDMGGWYIEDAEGNRLSLGIGRQIDPGAELRVYSSCGESTEEAVFACAGVEVLDDDGDALTLRDSAGGEVAVFPYGDEAP